MHAKFLPVIAFVYMLYAVSDQRRSDVNMCWGAGIRVTLLNGFTPTVVT